MESRVVMIGFILLIYQFVVAVRGTSHE